MGNHNDLGTWGENHIVSVLSEAGVTALPASPHDLQVEDVRIEVKTASPSLYRRNRNPGYQFCLERQGHARLQADVLILVCVHGPNDVTHYVIPRAAVKGQKKISIFSKTYRGKWSKWREMWGVIADAEDRYAQRQKEAPCRRNS